MSMTFPLDKLYYVDEDNYENDFGEGIEIFESDPDIADFDSLDDYEQWSEEYDAQNPFYSTHGADQNQDFHDIAVTEVDSNSSSDDDSEYDDPSENSTDGWDSDLEYFRNGSDTDSVAWCAIIKFLYWTKRRIFFWSD